MIAIALCECCCGSSNIFHADTVTFILKNTVADERRNQVSSWCTTLRVVASALGLSLSLDSSLYYQGDSRTIFS